jgi:hypothetical protein
MFISKFERKDGILNEQQVEEWAETFFHNMLTVMNTFFTHVDVEEAVSRMADIPFERVTREQLEGESDEVIAIAVKTVNELFADEMEFMRSYMDA